MNLITNGIQHVIYLFMCSSIVSILAQGDDTTCPKGFLSYQNKCLTTPDQTKLDWPNALGKCQDLGGSLPNIYSAVKQKILENFISSHYNASFLIVDLPSEYKYHYLDDYSTFIREEKHITFEFKGCNDAYLILSESRDDSVKSYEVLFGGWLNTLSVIRTCRQCQPMTSASHSPLSCDTYRPFWVSWSNGTIRAGEGKNVGINTFMEWTDPKPHPVNFLGISSWKTAPTHWKFNKDPYNSTFWLAGSDLGHTTEWQWFPDGGYVGYTNWLPEEPNYILSHHHCIQMSLHGGFKWATDNCMLKRNFICEIDHSSPIDTLG